MKIELGDPIKFLYLFEEGKADSSFGV